MEQLVAATQTDCAGALEILFAQFRPLLRDDKPASLFDISIEKYLRRQNPELFLPESGAEILRRIFAQSR